MKLENMLFPSLFRSFLTFISSLKTNAVVFLARCDTPSCWFPDNQQGRERGEVYSMCACVVNKIGRIGCVPWTAQVGELTQTSFHTQTRTLYAETHRILRSTLFYSTLTSKSHFSSVSVCVKQKECMPQMVSPQQNLTQKHLLYFEVLITVFAHWHLHKYL